MSVIIGKGLGSLGVGIFQSLIITQGLGGLLAIVSPLLAVSTDARHVEIIFSGRVSRESALDINNYLIDGGIIVYSVEYITDTVYLLTTSRQTQGQVYSITITVEPPETP